MSDKKRPFEGNGESSVSKKLKSESTSANGAASSKAFTTEETIAQNRAKITAKLAAMKQNALGLKGPVPAAPPKPAVPPAAMEDFARKVAEASKRVAEAQNKVVAKDNSHAANQQANNKGKQPRPVAEVQQGAGLKMAAHPLLLDNTPAVPQSKKDRYKPMQPKFASIKANVRNAPPPAPAPVPVPVAIETKHNPYTSGAHEGGAFEGAAPKERAAGGRTFRFVPKGKYVHLGDQMRQDNQLEALKQKIAESARKAGLDSEYDTLEKNIKRAPPPAAEWWDVAFLPNKTYDDLARGITSMDLRGVTSPITQYIQHPIAIPAPGDKNKAVFKPLMLTSREQKKMRKQRRQAELQDKQDRIRTGLLPPDPPKVRLANLMKVLTSDAVQDPTRVEARVRGEVARRKIGHEKMNAERKLTDEQRREKIETKKVEEEKKGIYGCVFKVKNLSDPAHRFKVRKNAEQNNLTGVCIFNPSFTMIYVEGAHKFIRRYKKLMLTRMAWTEAARPRGAEDVELDAGSENGGEGASSSQVKSTEAESQPAVSLEDNKCWLVWEGMLRDRSFHNFLPKTCPTDSSAREVLGAKLAGYWDQAKNWKPEEEDLY